VTLSRERLQDVVDDAVKRGRITRGDAEKLLGELVKRGRKQTDAMLGELERLVKQARKEVGGRAEAGRRKATKAARQARRRLG
jgi:polyhydroxyalkanoate synthesis regulator phasin